MSKLSAGRVLHGWKSVRSLRRTVAWVSLGIAVVFGFHATPASAAMVAPGNLIVFRVGDGVAALTTAAASVFLDEYSPLGTLVQTIPVPNTGATALTVVGSSTT